MIDTGNFEKMEREGWGDPAVAKGYAENFELATRVVAEGLSDAVMAGPNTKALDLCTGHGVVAAALSSRGASVTGLDFSAAMISLAQVAAPDVEFVQGDAMAMDFADDSFDAVTIGFGVPHLPDPERGIAEAERVLKPGGRIAFSVWCGQGSDGAFGWLFDAVERFGASVVTLPPGPDAHKYAELAAAAAMMARSGFVNVQLTSLKTELGIRAPEALFDAFERGTVRAAALLDGQSNACRDAIRADLAAKTRSGGKKHAEGHLVPAPSVIISAIRN